MLYNKRVNDLAGLLMALIVAFPNLGGDMAVNEDRIHKEGRVENPTEAHERNRRWIATKKAIDALAGDVVDRCVELRLTPVRLRGLAIRHAWTFDLMTAGAGPWDALAHMHLGFLPDGDWVLLGYHRGDYRLVVDKSGPLHPGLRQGFIYDRKRHEADVILTLTGEQIWEAICSQMDILIALECQTTTQILPRPRYG